MQVVSMVIQKPVHAESGLRKHGRGQRVLLFMNSCAFFGGHETKRFLSHFKLNHVPEERRIY